GPAQVWQIAASEHSVPVRVVGLAAPERDLATDEPRVVRALRERAVESTREPQHLPVCVADLRVLHEEAPPEAAAKEAGQARAVRQTARVGFGRLERAGGVGRQGPFPHLAVRGRWQIDAAAGRDALDDVAEGRRLEPGRGQQAVEEAIEPSALVDA